MTSFDTWPPIRIAGTGAYVPERVVTNAELVASGLDTTDEWVVSHTGIRERRWASDAETTASLAAESARRALAAADVHVDEIDLLVLATSSPDWIQPATASAVHHALGMRHDAGVFDDPLVGGLEPAVDELGIRHDSIGDERAGAGDADRWPGVDATHVPGLPTCPCSGHVVAP
jgi:hypothetical protein